MRKSLLFSVAFGLTTVSFGSLAYGGGYPIGEGKPPVSVSDINIQNAVTGRVTGAEGPLAGVTVAVVGGTTSTSTDAEGSYSIQAPMGATLRFTYLGYHAKDVVVSGNTLDVNLEAEDTTLDEVVVVGYGSQRRSNITGAVSTVDTEKTFETRPITDVGRALQGAVSGLSVSTPSGDLGGDPTIRLRGVSGSLQTQGGASPLILVDGVEVPSLSMINPTDIETMSVVKDASAAIYGSRAAWGVVLIKTKSGKRNTKTSINYSNNIALQKPTTTPVIAGGAEGARAGLLAQQRTNPSLTGYNNLGTRYDDYAIEKMEEWERLYGGQNLGLEMVEGRDWEVKDGFLYFHRPWDAESMFMRDFTPQQNHNLSITGGSDKVNYNAGFGLVSQTGILKENPDKYNRYNFNLGINADLNDWLTGFAKVLYSASDVSKPYSFNGDVFEPIFYMYRWPRNFPYGTIDGLPMRNAITDVQQANMNVRTLNMTRISFGGQATIMEGLTLDADYTYSQYLNRFDINGGSVTGWDFWNKTDFDYMTYTGATHDRARKERSMSTRHVANIYATYDKSFDDAHNFKFMAGANAELAESDNVWGQRLGLLDQSYPQLGLATGDQTTSSGASHWSTLGFFGRINYDYQNKYLFEVLARYDGSSRFNKENVWGFFPAMSAGYVLSQEEFMDWTKPYLDFLKVRASWGSVGNQTVPTGLYLSTLSQAPTNWVIDGVNQNTMTTPTIVSQDLTWETVTTQEIGIDAAFFQNKFNVTFNRFRRTISDLITGGVILPSSFGALSPLRNFGEMQTNGWELELAYNHSFSNGLNMRLAGQLSDFKETITKFDGQAQVNVNGTSTNYEGKLIGEIWGYETDRLFQVDDFIANPDGTYTLKEGIPSQSFYETPNFKFGPGDIKYKDLNGDGVIGIGDGTVQNPGDRRIIGNSNPRYQYGFRADFDYKGFDLGFFLQGVGSRDIWAGGDFIVPGWRPAEAWYTHQMDYWTPENTGAFYYRPTDQGQSNTTLNHMPQTRYLLDMSYLRLKNLTFGYTLPSSVMEKAKISKLRVFFSGENLLEFDNLDVPVDPEIDYTVEGRDDSNAFGRSGNDLNTFGRSYPYRRTFSLGLQLTF
ncbi:TonB-dependent receptor [Sphingobacterium sp. DN00404]|uniref:TonB-dependent receptor n=1 Tax=Sphingobacterium micropteri TaxID=2763501 RepID=A0ABR7YKV1_9SPHI|nr:TonB-dependent receptor [Sphingobacterium micropteri]MBD1431950.1 TonB-dependent receptor [Sphingobacterium micropteri]